MNDRNHSTECPKCASRDHVREKLLLIDELNAEHLKGHPGERWSCSGELSVDGLKPEVVSESPLQQFVRGLFCERCEVGFVPEEMAKPEAQSWKLSEQGFHRVNPDGSLGPPQEFMK